MMQYKVYFVDNSKMKVSDLRLVQALRIKKVKERKFLVFWKKIDHQTVLRKLEAKV